MSLLLLFLSSAAATAANAGLATATGSAETAAVAIAATPGAGSGTGAAYDATAQTVAAPVWTAPDNGAHMVPQPELTFTIPAVGDGIHFWLELDTADTFDTGSLRQYRSDQDQAGWDYWDGGAWADVPAGGVASAYAGNEARLSVPTPLTSATWFRRVKAGA